MVKKRKKTPQEEPVLTDWQKRNLEFLKKKEAEQQAKLKQEEALRAEKRSQLQAKDEQPSKPSKQAKRTKMVKARKPKRQPTVSQRAKRQALPVFLLAGLVLVLSLFFISPFSQDKVLVVRGNRQAQAEAISKDTGIKASDYLTQVWLKRKTYENQLKKTNPWVKTAKISYQFPNRFQIKVSEYGILAYTMTADGYQPILENGKRVRAVGTSQLPDNFLMINLSDDKQITTLVEALMKLDKKLRQEIRSVSLTPTKATADLLTLEMTGGFQVRVPLSDLAVKLPYYNRLTNLEGVGIVDMEIGIYTTNEDLEASASQAAAQASQSTSQESSSTTNEENSSGDTSSSAEESSQTETTVSSTEATVTE